MNGGKMDDLPLEYSAGDVFPNNRSHIEGTWLGLPDDVKNIVLQDSDIEDTTGCFSSLKR